MGAKQFFKGCHKNLAQIEETQIQNITKVAHLAADAIAVDRFAAIFGTGHSYMAAADTFPRIGSYPGWLPIHELATSYVATVSGNQGIRQASFIEKVEGFGHVILQNYRLDARDLMIIVSNSGVNTVNIEIALEARELGLKTVAITSIAQSKISRSKHGSGKRLFEVCDIVIDTCVRPGDALVDIAGYPQKVASVSTIIACAIMQSIVAETAKILSSRNIVLPVYPSHNSGMTAEEDEVLEEQVEMVLAEHTRRTAGIFK